MLWWAPCPLPFQKQCGRSSEWKFSNCALTVRGSLVECLLTPAAPLRQSFYPCCLRHAENAPLRLCVFASKLLPLLFSLCENAGGLQHVCGGARPYWWFTELHF